MVYSARAIVAAERFHDPYFFLKKQLFWAVLGGLALWGALRTDYRRLEGLVVPLLGVAGGLLVLVLLPPGRRVVPAGGAREARPRRLSRGVPRAAPGRARRLPAGAAAAARGGGPVRRPCARPAPPPELP